MSSTLLIKADFYSAGVRSRKRENVTKVKFNRFLRSQNLVQKSRFYPIFSQQGSVSLRAVLMGTKSCTKILILPKIFPTRFRFTFYG